MENVKSKASKLSIGTKLAYGAGDLGAAIVAAITGFFLNAFLLDVALLNPSSVAIIFLVSTLWDAVTDPLVGNLSDRTRSRWGRRRPWLLFGAIPFGLAFWLHWQVPALEGTALFMYYMVVALLLKTAFTAVNVPYTALTPELTKDYDERTSLNAFRFSFSILGGVAAVGLHPVLVGMFSDDIKLGYTMTTAIWAFFIIASAWVTFAFTRETEQKPSTEKFDFVGGIKVVFQSRPFLTVTGIYLLSWLTLQLVQTNLLFYVRYWVRAEDSFTLMVLILQITAFLFLAVWSNVSARIGKKKTYAIGAGIWLVVMLALFFVPEETITPMYFISFLAGTGVSVAYLLPWSMLPDVIEYDELKTGQRREGVYYGFFVFLQKLGLSLGLALSNLLLGAAGYINPEVAGEAVTQPDSVLMILRVIVSILPAILLAISIPLALSFPITPESFAEIKRELAENE